MPAIPVVDPAHDLPVPEVHRRCRPDLAGAKHSGSVVEEDDRTVAVADHPGRVRPRSPWPGWHELRESRPLLFPAERCHAERGVDVGHARTGEMAHRPIDIRIALVPEVRVEA